MLQEFLSAISRSISTTPAVNPYAGGAGGANIPLQSVFGKMFNNLIGSFTGGPANIANSIQGFGGQTQSSNPAAQAYANSLAGGQNFFGAVQPQTFQREAFSPGSVINTLQVPPASQISQLTNAINPLQGFAGQAGVGGFAGQTGVGGFAGQTGAGGFTLPGSGFTPNGAGGFGKLSMLIMPLIGLVGIVKSLFSLRGTGAMQPFQRDKNSLVAYRNSLENYNKAQHTDGSFDDDYWGEGEGESESASSDFDSSKLEI